MAAAQKTGGGVKLPPVTVGKFQAALLLLERLFESQQESFLTRMQDYRERHREATSRPLTASEAAQYATAMREVLGEQAPSPADLQNSDLYGYDQPGTQELLAAAGLATAPALVDSCRQLVALIEMPSARFRQAQDDDLLPEAIEEAAAQFDDLELAEARDRTMAAISHFSIAAGAGERPGEVIGSLIQTVMGALEQAASRATQSANSSIVSPEATGGPVETSSASTT